MSSQNKIEFYCQECENTYLKWQGKCDECGAWNTIQERAVSAPSIKKDRLSALFAIDKSPEIKPLNSISTADHERIVIGVKELDNVFGGGITSGSVNLIGGQPGIGKSTLMLQILNRLPGKKLYISGEESAQQIKNRADRLLITPEEINLLCENELEAMIPQIKNFSPDYIVVDSIQSVYTSSSNSSAGSVSQIKECGSFFLQIAKQHNISVFLIGHVTKEGGIAGPRVLEHMVDTVLFFENSRNDETRLLRTFKNRFGSVNEIGLFKMTDRGLTEYKSGEFLQRRKKSLLGCALSVVVEGSRAFAVEIQSLVTASHNGYPQRTVTGFDQKRLTLLLASYEKYLGQSLGNTDVYLKLSGGLQSGDPVLDLGIIASIYSSFNDVKISADIAFIGEVGLTGEIRGVPHMDIRIKEMERLGIKKIFGPFKSVTMSNTGNVKLVKVENITDMLKFFTKMNNSRKSERNH